MRRTIRPVLLSLMLCGLPADVFGEGHDSDFRGTASAALTSGRRQKNEDPFLLKGKEGTVYLAWFSDSSGHANIYLRTSRDGVRWTAPVAAVEGGPMSFYPSLAQTPDGTLHLCCFRIDSESKKFSLWHARSKDGKQWSGPRALTSIDADYNWAPSLIAANDGALRLAWASGRTGNKDIFLMGSEDGGDTWSEPAQVTSHPDHDDLPRLAQKPDGSFVLLWTRYAPGKEEYLSPTSELYLATSKDATTWTAPQAITKNEHTDTLPVVYANQDRSSYFLAWCTAQGVVEVPLSEIEARPRHLLASADEGYSPSLLALDARTYLIVWVREVEGDLHLFSRRFNR